MRVEGDHLVEPEQLVHLPRGGASRPEEHHGEGGRHREGAEDEALGGAALLEERVVQPKGEVVVDLHEEALGAAHLCRGRRQTLVVLGDGWKFYRRPVVVVAVMTVVPLVVIMLTLVVAVVPLVVVVVPLVVVLVTLVVIMGTFVVPLVVVIIAVMAFVMRVTMVLMTELMHVVGTVSMKVIMLPAVMMLTMILLALTAVVVMILVMVAMAIYLGQWSRLLTLVRFPGCREQNFPVAVGHLLKGLQRLRLGRREGGQRRGGLSGGRPRDYLVRNRRCALPRRKLGRIT